MLQKHFTIVDLIIPKDNDMMSHLTPRNSKSVFNAFCLSLISQALVSKQIFLSLHMYNIRDTVDIV